LDQMTHRGPFQPLLFCDLGAGAAELPTRLMGSNGRSAPHRAPGSASDGRAGAGPGSCSHHRSPLPGADPAPLAITCSPARPQAGGLRGTGRLAAAQRGLLPAHPSAAHPD